MGLLVDGVWHDDSHDTGTDPRTAASARPTTNSATGSRPTAAPGPTGEGGFPAEAGRYHLYVSLACPWAHRTLIFRKLKKLESVDLDVGASLGYMGDDGWTFDTQRRLDRRHGQRHAASCRRSICGPTRNTPAASPCRCCGTRSGDTIVNNESSEIIRMFNSAFDAFTDERTDYYPPALRERDRCASTTSSTRPSTTASTARASPPRRRPTRRRSARCSRRSTSSSGGCRGSAISRARA